MANVIDKTVYPACFSKQTTMGLCSGITTIEFKNSDGKTWTKTEKCLNYEKCGFRNE